MCLHVHAYTCMSEYVHVWMLCVCVCVCMYVAQEVQKMDIKFLELELQMVASCPAWVLEPKSRPLEEQEVLFHLLSSPDF